MNDEVVIALQNQATALGNQLKYADVCRSTESQQAFKATLTSVRDSLTAMIATIDEG